MDTILIPTFFDSEWRITLTAVYIISSINGDGFEIGWSSCCCTASFPDFYVFSLSFGSISSEKLCPAIDIGPILSDDKPVLKLTSLNNSIQLVIAVEATQLSFDLRFALMLTEIKHWHIECIFLNSIFETPSVKF